MNYPKKMDQPYILGHIVQNWMNVVMFYPLGGSTASNIPVRSGADDVSCLSGGFSTRWFLTQHHSCPPEDDVKDWWLISKVLCLKPKSSGAVQKKGGAKEQKR